MNILYLQNIRTVYGCVTLPNENSEKLHAYFGFKRVGVYHNAGYKFDQWHDVIWFEKKIAEYDLNPKLFASIQTIDPKKISEILNHYTALLNAK